MSVSHDVIFMMYDVIFWTQLRPKNCFLSLLLKRYRCNTYVNNNSFYLYLEQLLVKL